MFWNAENIKFDPVINVAFIKYIMLTNSYETNITRYAYKINAV